MAKETIYIVDDNPTNLMAGKNALEDHYDVLTLNSGERLLKTLEKRAPALILLDVEMPEMNGYDVIKAIRANPGLAAIPVIFLTAKADAESELLGLSLGAVDYITKPFSQPRLLKRIEMHLLVERQKKVLMSQKQELVQFNNSLQEMVSEKTRSVFDLQSAIIETMAELVECRDDTTGGHIARTTRYLGIMIRSMAERDIYSETMMQWNIGLLLQSAQLHDVGKISVSDAILQKPGKLTPEEFEEIKKHTVYGKEIVDTVKSKAAGQDFLEYAGVFALSHHERWDGSGYPYGLAGDTIPLVGRIMAFADVYDALVSDRPYKKAFPHTKAVDIIMEGKGTHFDPNLADLFLEVSDEFNSVHSVIA